jgi:hypothetical protein
MKLKDIPNSTARQMVPENPVEEAACNYLRNHTPIFAGCELNVTSAFVAGVQWRNAQKDPEPGKLTKQDYATALQIQDAVNLNAILNEFVAVFKKVRIERPATQDQYEHPIVVLFASKIESLTQCSDGEVLRKAIQFAQFMSKG